MKKILSILICLVLGISSAWAAESTVTLKVNPTTSFSPAAAGVTATTTVCSSSSTDDCATSSTACANQSPFKATAKKDNTSFTVSLSGLGTVVTKILDLLAGTATLEYAFYLSTEIDKPDYVFSHWEDGNGNAIANLDKQGIYNYSTSMNYSDLFDYSYESNKNSWTSYTIIVTFTGKNPTVTINPVAHWIQPQVVGADKETLDLGTIIDPNGSATGQVTFNLNNDINFHNYTLEVSEGFVATLGSYDSRSGKAVINVTRTASGVHGTYNGTVTLRSNYPQNNGTFKTVAIQVVEDYTPQYSIPTNFDFGTVYTGAKKSSDVALYATAKNPAATIPAPTAPAINGTTWSANITGADASAFEVMNTQNGDVVVRFAPTEERAYEADLEVTVIYTDADGGTPILQYTTHTTLTGNGKIPLFSAITFEPESLNFGDVVTNQVATSKVDVIEQNVSDLTYDFGDTNPNGIFTYTATDGLLTVKALSTNILGIHTATLTATGNDTRDGESGITTGSIEMTVHVKMQSPVLEGGTNLKDTYYLSWEKVPCATVYEIYQVEGGVHTLISEYTTLVDNATTMTVGISSSSAQNTYVLKAINVDGTYYAYSNEVTINLNTITQTGTPYLELYTGTDIYINGHATYGAFPYRKKCAINLEAAFSPAGVPLFDKLYIFGMTTSATAATVSGQTGYKITPANNSKGSDAITPCYIYTNNDNGGYNLTQTIPNMNVANKPISDISGATSVYLTGYCPYASTGGGNNKDENGVFCFTGGAGEKLHVYIDDLRLHARYKSNNGNTSKPDTITFSGLQTTFYCAGTAASFCFKGTSTSSSNPFKPIIHMRDSSRLTGTTGSAIKVEVSFLGMSMVQRAGQYNSPITLLSDDGTKYTELSIDDVWPASMADNASGDVRTNGYLDIRGGSGAPSIDLYDNKGKLNFNGGRYYLKNSTPTGSNNYLCTFAVGYRKYEKTVSGIKATMYGLGTDQSGGEVNFNNGSFYVDAVTDSVMKKHGQYYHHKYALKCPASSKINGGTYYCEPFGCTKSENKGASPLNQYGDGLVLDTVAVESLLEPYHTAVINFPNDKQNTGTVDAAHPLTLGEYYALPGRTPYGISSLNPYQGIQAPDSVILMIPAQYTNKELQKEVVNVPWAMCVPEVLAGGTITLGGDIEVEDKEENNTIYQTNYILYGSIDEYIVEMMADEEYNYQTPEYDGLPQASVEFPGEEWSSEVLNYEPYTIQQEQYMLMSVKADEWMLFSPPFDISEVYVIETCNEAELVAEATNNGWQSAMNVQAASNMDFFYALCYNIGYLESVNKFDGIFYSWKTDLKPAGAGGQVKLTHFTGSNYTAHYYLQRSSGTWKWDAEKERFVTDWQYLPKTMEKVTHGDTEYSVVMKKGEIYSMKFPYMYYGYRDPELIGKTGEKNWDYWTGKYILLVGKGPQTIEGINYHDNIDADMTASPGTAEVRVNPTFAAIEIIDKGAYFLGENQKFNTNPYDDYGLIEPTSGFVLANTNTPTPMPQRIKSIDMQTGEVTTESNVSTSTPTIGGNNHMFVYNIAGGVGIVPVVGQQVSIYNAAGQLVTSQYLTDEVHIPLPTGIYLISGVKDQFKTVVK